jgi:uncharacterized protein
VITATFQLGAACGPRRELRLWEAGVTHWSEYGSATSRALLKGTADIALREAIATGKAALAAGDVDRLASLLPTGEHWRLFEEFGKGAAYLDIETCDDVVGFAGISAIGWLDRRGLRLVLAGRELERFPELAQGWSMLVTFNGLSFDVPILQRAFPDWKPPSAHCDLRHLLARLGVCGGLKSIEKSLASLHLQRPAHIAGLSGSDTGWLFRRGRDGDRAALRRFAEYNLYDVIALPTLMAYAHNALVEAHAARAPALREAVGSVHVPGRGDVLYDVSKILLGL